MKSMIETVIYKEKQALDTLLTRVDQYEKIANYIQNCTGKVIFMGVGKSAHIGEKLAATFASLGIPSFFVHATESMHGDLGMIEKRDVVILMSNSGETIEVVQTLKPLESIGCLRIAFTGNADSTLAKGCEHVLYYEKPAEADENQLAPTTSTTMMLVLGDALACTISKERRFTRQDFLKFHPGGKLGSMLREESVE